MDSSWKQYSIAVIIPLSCITEIGQQNNYSSVKNRVDMKTTLLSLSTNNAYMSFTQTHNTKYLSIVSTLWELGPSCVRLNVFIGSEGPSSGNCFLRIKPAASSGFQGACFSVICDSIPSNCVKVVQGTRIVLSEIELGDTYYCIQDSKERFFRKQLADILSVRLLFHCVILISDFFVCSDKNSKYYIFPR